VVDMFGCCVPVCAVYFSTLKELVFNGKNGYVFEDAADLAILLKHLFTNFPKNVDARTSKLHQMRTFLTENRAAFDWNATWTKVADPVFRKKKRY